MLSWLTLKTSSVTKKLDQKQVLQIDGKKVVVKEKLGEGGFGVVYSCTGDGGTGYALKRVLAQEAEEKASIETEIGTLQSLKGQKNVIALYGVSKRPLGSGVEYNILMELCSNSLANLMLKETSSSTLYGEATGPGPWNEQKIASIFLQICLGVRALHSLKPPRAHRDLKVENVLLGTDGLWKLCDFGSCTDRQKVYSTSQEITVEQENIQKNCTAVYRAPEMVDLYRRQLVGTKGDIWALGCMLYMLAFFSHPFPDGAGNLAILKGTYDLPPHRYSSSFITLLAQLLTSDPSKRLDIEQTIKSTSEWENLARTGKLPTLLDRKSTSTISKKTDTKKTDSGLSTLESGKMDAITAQKLWRKYDKDGSGYLDRKEGERLFRHYCRTKGLRGEEAKKKVKELFRKFDADGDGKISVSEFLGFEKELRGKETTKTDLIQNALKPGRLDLFMAQKLWRAYDKDKNGVLDRKEAESLFTDFCLSRGLSSTEAKLQIKELWETFDVDGDGLITFSELMGWDQEGWTCERCSLINESKHALCLMCSAQKPAAQDDWAQFDDEDVPVSKKASSKAPSTSVSQPKVDDWAVFED